MGMLVACEYGAEPDPLKNALLNAPSELVFKGLLAGQFAHLVVHDCAVYMIEDQSLSKGKETVTVELGRMAFGAGGCCATGGTYRTTDGRGWKKL